MAIREMSSKPSELTSEPCAPIVQIPDGPDGRTRLIGALAAAIRRRPGYRGTTPNEVVTLAHTSKRTFYQHFRSVDECFLALYDEFAPRMLAHITNAVDQHAPAREQATQALAAWMAALYADPQLALAVFRELPALGPDAHDRQREVLLLFARTLLSRLREEDLAASEIPFVDAVFVLGGLREAAVYGLDRGVPEDQMRESLQAMALTLFGPLPG